MGLETNFRIAVAVAIVLVVAIALPFRLRSGATRERLDRRQEGLFILATLRPAGAALWIGIVAYLINPDRMAWSSVALPVWLRWTGAGVCAMAAAFLWWTLRSLGPNLTDTVVTRQAHTLVTSGPYRWVRHPFYDSVAMIMLAVSLLTANWFIFAAGATLFTLLAIRADREEANLVARFGASYQEYMDRTGRFLPRFK